MLRVLRYCVVMCWLVPASVSAQWIDYDLLFETHADDLIETSAGDGSLKTVLEFDNGVRITRTGPAGDYRYLGEDLTTHGAIGCAFNIVVELRLYGQICSKLLDGLDADSFESAFQQLNAFVARNGFPEVDEEENKIRADTYIQNRYNDADAVRNICVEDKIGELDHLRGLFDGFIVSEQTGALKEMLAVPRLPVSNPCL